VLEPTSSGPLVSVRGEARQSVPPDLVRLPGSLTAAADSKADALQAVAASLHRLTSDLAGLGGVPLPAGTQRQPLTWSAHRATTQPEHLLDEQAGQYRATGRVRADVAVLVTVRALDALDALGEMVAKHERLAVHDAAWAVDADNPAWPAVRAAAVRDAIGKARHYAAALGGTLVGVLHLTDAGLLDGSGAGGHAGYVRQQASGHGPNSARVPPLDPLPQELLAVVEARFVADVAVLDPR
jgi:uncharacterized protein YggE